MKENHAVTTERNSPIRRKLSGLLNAAAENFVTVFPEITADHVTWTGAVGGIACSILEARRNKKNFLEEKNSKSKVLLASNLFFASLDLIDGTIARVRKKLFPKKVNKFGWAHDVTADRLGELGRLFGEIETSESMKGFAGFWGKATAITIAITKDLPGIARARKESQGKTVDESGGNIFEFFGTSGGRTLLEIGALYFPVIRKFPVLPVVNTFLLAATLNTAIKRSKETEKNQQAVLPEEKIKEARQRKKLLIGISVGSGLFLFGRELLLSRRHH